METIWLTNKLIWLTWRAAALLGRGLVFVLTFGMARAADMKSNDLVVRRARRIVKIGTARTND